MSDGGTLVLGGGFGGLAVAHGLRDALGPGHPVTVVDRAPRFSMGLRKLWELVGNGTVAEGSRPRDRLAERGITFVQADIASIDPAARAAETSAGPLRGDHLVVALGAVSRPDLVPGLEAHGHDVWDVRRIGPAASALAGLAEGHVLILVAGAPYPCPPAPYECAFHVDEHLRERGVRDRVDITVATIQPMLMPNAGREGSDWMAERLEERGIAHRAGLRVERVEDGRVVLEDGAVAFDLLFAVPPHRVPAVVSEAGLTGDSGWIEVDGRTFATRFPGVFAVGDVTLVRLANGLPLPKAGVMAEREGARVAAAIAAEVGETLEPAPFDGRGHCFIEMGRDVAAAFEGAFYAEPSPDITMLPPGPEHAAAKRAFETERLARWFGPAGG